MITLLVTLFSIFTLSAQDLSGQDYKGYVEINGNEVWVEYTAPKNGAPLIPLLNGMTYSTEQWEKFHTALQAESKDFGVLKYDMRGQGKTLAAIPNVQALYLEFAEVSKKFSAIHDYKNPMEYFKKLMSGEIILDSLEYFNSLNRLWSLMGQMQSGGNMPEEILAQDQSKDLRELLKMFAGNSKVHLVGLSYGGAVGLQYLSEYPKSVNSLTLMAPFVRKLRQQDDWVKIQIQIARAFNPFLHAVPDADLYRFFFRVLVYGTYPSAEPILLENPLKLEAAFRLAIGLLEFNGTKIVSNFPKRKVHLMVAMQDQHVEKRILDELWKELNQSRASRVLIQDSMHKIPELVPNFSARWVARIANEDPLLQQGKTFERKASVIEVNPTKSLQKRTEKPNQGNIFRINRTKLSLVKSCKQVFTI